MTNPSTIWASLASPSQASGSIPYVDIDNISILTNVGNFWLNPTSYQLSVKTAGDQTGTDSLNTYFNQDTYWPYNAAVATPLGAAGTVAAHTVSTSRGTGVVPSNSLSGDFVGKFSGFAYTGTAPGTPGYQELGSINIYAMGTNAATNGIGGEMRFSTKQDNGNQLEWVKLTTTGAFQPVAANSTALGAANYGWTSLFLAYTNNTTPGTFVTCNSATGRVQLAAAGTAVVITNSFITATSVVIVMVESADATATFIKRVQPAAGQVTVTMNAAATAAVQLSFLVVGN